MFLRPPQQRDFDQKSITEKLKDNKGRINRKLTKEMGDRFYNFLRIIEVFKKKIKLVNSTTCPTCTDVIVSLIHV